MQLRTTFVVYLCIEISDSGAERELDLVQSQVFLEVEKNPLFYHNLLTLNFNTDLGSKWALKMVYSLIRTFRHYFMVKQGC